MGIQIITDLMDKGSLIQVSTLVKTQKQQASLASSAQPVLITEEELGDEPIGFLQLGQPRKLLAVLSHGAAAMGKAASSTETGRMEVVSLLRSKGKELRSELLTKLADKVE